MGIFTATKQQTGTTVGGESPNKGSRRCTRDGAAFDNNCMNIHIAMYCRCLREGKEG